MSACPKCGAEGLVYERRVTETAYVVALVETEHSGDPVAIVDDATWSPWPLVDDGTRVFCPQIECEWELRNVDMEPQ